MNSHTSSPARRARIGACLIAPLLMFSAVSAHGQTAPAPAPDPSKQGGKGKITLPPKDGFTLTYNSEVDISSETATKLVSAFYNAMLKECADFDWACPKSDTLNVVASIPDCAGTKEAPACAGGNTITVNYQHLKKYPLDTELVTHEAMHLLQNYGGATGTCGYWTEGLADFARDLYGNADDNRKANWSLKQGNSYKDNYDKTGHFLRWIGKQYKFTTIVALHNHMKKGTCPDDTFWKDKTTLGLDALWTKYAGKPPLTTTRTTDPTEPTEPTTEPTEPTTEPTEPSDYPGDEEPGDYPGDEAPGDYPTDEEPGDYPTDEEPGDYPTDEEPGDYPTDEEPGDYPGDEGESEEELP